MTVKSYKDLIAWQKAVALVGEVFRVSEFFPKQQVYVLAAQMQRAALSVPSNIAEGQGRGSTRDFVHFLEIARGSLFELETQLVVAFNLGYIRENHSESLLDNCAEVGRLINGLIQSLENRSRGTAAGH